MSNWPKGKLILCNFSAAIEVVEVAAAKGLTGAEVVALKEAVMVEVTGDLIGMTRVEDTSTKGAIAVALIDVVPGMMVDQALVTEVQEIIEGDGEGDPFMTETVIEIGVVVVAVAVAVVEAHREIITLTIHIISLIITIRGVTKTIDVLDLIKTILFREDRYSIINLRIL